MDDFLDALVGDATKLAGVATTAGASDITSAITGQPVTPIALLQQQAQQQAAQNSQLLFLLVIGFVIYKLVK